MTEGGQKTRRTTLELVLIRLRNMAIEGENSRAITELHKLLEKYEPRIRNPNAGVHVAPAPNSEEEWVEEVKLQNAVMAEHGFQNLAEVEEFQRQQRKKMER